MKDIFNELKANREGRYISSIGEIINDSRFEKVEKDDALFAVNGFNMRQLQYLEYELSLCGWYCTDKRRLRAYATDVIIYNWEDSKSRSEILRCIYNAELLA